MIVNNWLPEGKKCAVIFTVDDLHPANNKDHGYDAGGDLGEGAFGHIDWLLNRHPGMKVTLFATADWREIFSFPTRKLLAKIPVVRDWFYLTEILPKNTFNILNFPEFVAYYNKHPQVEIGLHGLHHVHKGLKIPIEFQEDSYEVCNYKISEMLRIFKEAGLEYVNGFTPPAWNAPPNLVKVLIEKGVRFLTSARDLITPITKEATNNMSGMKGVSILYPEYIYDKQMIHIPTNFQITSELSRAEEIMDLNGLLSIKGHIIKTFRGYDTIDGIDAKYMQFLDTVLSKMEDKYGDQIWWTSPNEITQKIYNHENNTNS